MGEQLAFVHRVRTNKRVFGMTWDGQTHSQADFYIDSPFRPSLANEIHIIVIHIDEKFFRVVWHCFQERITNPQKLCQVKPKWFLDLWTYFEHAHIEEIWQQVWTQVAPPSFFQKVAEIKNEKNFTIKKPFVTPNFWCRNFSRMHHF